jgi:putative copper resistance protein D
MEPSLLADPGDFVRWTQPAFKALTNISMAVAIGSAVFAAFAVADNSPQLKRSLNLIAASSVAWVVFGLFSYLLTYLTIAGTEIGFGTSFTAGLNIFMFEIALGQSMAINLLFGAALATVALMVSSHKATVFLAIIGLAGLIPMAVSGHAAGSADHATAVNSIGMHLVAIVVWVGGLVALVVTAAGAPAGIRVDLLRRFSSLALIAFVITAVSGTASALVRTELPYLFTSSYGLLVVAKVVALLILGAFGAWYRLRLIDKAHTDAAARTFGRLAVAELLVMGIAIGLGTALARTGFVGEPNLGDSPTPAEILTGQKLPNELVASSWFTEFKPDLIWAVVCIGAAVFYIWGVLRLRARGDSWPIARTISWLLGLALLAYITCGAINVYQEYLFSVHMIGHMLLSMGVPVLLVPGAPITLLLRAVHKRTDASRGAREWVLWALNTPFAQFVSNPLFAAVNFAGSLVLFYYTPAFSFSVHDHLGHEWMTVHFLITGYLFVQALVGIDPGPNRLPYTIRLMLLIGTLAFHAFFGLALMSGDALLLPEWYGAMGRSWGPTPIEDQHTGGAIAWGIGELPTAVLTIIVSVQWARADKRDATRLDRASDRSGGQDIEEYNAMLARLAQRKDR